MPRLTVSFRLRTLLAAAACVAIASVCQAQTTPCSNAPATGIDAVYIRLNYVGDPLRDGDRLLASFPSKRIKTDMTRKGDNWLVVLADLPGVGVTPLQQLPTMVEPHLTGWGFAVRRDAMIVRNENVDEHRLCTARMLFDATPVWRLRVTAFPKTLALPVTCGEPCGRDAKTEFLTKQVPATERLEMVVNTGGPCSYPVTISPHEKFPMKVSSDTIVERLLGSGCDIWERRARSIKIPTEILIGAEQ